MIAIGLMGFGVVGQGVADIFYQKRSEWEEILGEPLQLKWVLTRNASKGRDVRLQETRMTTWPGDILDDPEVSIIIEVTGDVDQGYVWIKQALQSKKHVITANKALLSAHFEELHALADGHGVYLLYEASVAGAIPIIKALKNQIRVQKISALQGIINGSCNYILSKMSEEGLEYSRVVAEAQALGYLEADPSADVLGWDAMRKLRILSTLAFGGCVCEEGILCQGIQSIQAGDIARLAKHRRSVKLIGWASLNDDRYQAVVEPVACSMGSIFAQASGAMNLVELNGSFSGKLSFGGPGAGRYPTTNAVISDLLDVLFENQNRRDFPGNKVLVNDNDQIRGSYYLRTSAAWIGPARSLLKDVWSEDPFCGVTHPMLYSDLAPWLGREDACVIRYMEEV